MPKTTFIVISDLHLADGHAVLEGFRAQQQAALEGLLQAASPGGTLSGELASTLIINGDCFDFLAVPPYSEDGVTTPQIALEKLAKIAEAHSPFFVILRAFLDAGGTVVFLPGNHDIELCFSEIRAEVLRLVAGEQGQTQRVYFGLDQSYQPRPDIYIEHGNQYDFWNYASGIWDEQGRALTPQPAQITLPLGTQYMQRAALPIGIRYPYFDHFDPSLGATRQIGLLSLFDPEMVVTTARQMVRMMSHPYEALQNLAPGDKDQPALLFAQAIPDFALFRDNMFTHIPDWQVIGEQIYTDTEREQDQLAAVAEFFALHAALQESTEAALKALFHPIPTPVDDGTTRGMHNVLLTHPELHIAIAGHTHHLRQDQLAQGEQLYLNTASWTIRYQPPVPEELTPEIIAWLRQPDPEHFPFHDKTGAIFALISAEDNQPSTANLWKWEGGRDGTARILEK